LRLFSSVKGRVLAGFGAIVLILVASLTGSAILVRDYQSAVAEMETYSRIASLVQDTRSEAGNAALGLQRYVVSGDETDLPLIQESIDNALESGRLAAEEEARSGDGRQALALSQLNVAGVLMGDIANEIVTRRQAGDVAGATALIDQVVPQFRDFRIKMDAIADYEMNALSNRSDHAERAGDLALALLIASGISGVTVALAAAYVVTQSIVRPLTKLEATAREIGEGNLNARTAAAGPRELRNLGATLNDMAERLQQRENDLVLTNAELRERNRQLLEARVQAATDGLTALPNHRSFHERIRDAVRDAEPSRAAVSAIMLDIDHFKKVNDELGHLEGDEILRACSEILAATAGEKNVYRYGGDEFALVLDDTDIEQATAVADTLRKAIEQQSKELHGITISLGVAEFPSTATSAEELIYRADAAMYTAKSRGKNVTCRWDRMDEAAPAKSGRRDSAPVR
jgi:diguanylate cyclase (GGDEF)-like protein